VEEIPRIKTISKAALPRAALFLSSEKLRLPIGMTEAKKSEKALHPDRKSEKEPIIGVWKLT
jgi:hypothetical protein